MASVNPYVENQKSTGWWLGQGVIGGIVAGIVFAMFEMAFAWLMTGSPWGPLRMIAGIVIAQPPPQIDLTMAVIVGMMLHMVFSMMFGAIFGAIASAVPALRTSGTWMILFATLFGLVLWPLNFFVIAPMIGAGYFATEPNQLWQGFVAHTFFFGTVLGIYLDRAYNGQTD